MELALGGGTLKSVSAYRKYSIAQKDADSDVTGADLIRYDESFRSRFISQELTYNAKIEALHADVVLGAFFSDEKLNMGRRLAWGRDAQTYWDTLFAPLPAGIFYAAAGDWSIERMHGKSRSYAGFAHVDFAIGDKFNVITGLRYSIDKKQGAFANPFYRSQANDVLRVLNQHPGPVYDRSLTNRALSGTVGLQYRPVDDVMLYATYNRGYKAGGVNMDVNAAGLRSDNPAEVPGAKILDPRYRPEKINAYELGAKVQYLNRRARTNIALFYYDISDLQVSQFVGLRFTVLNSRKAKDYGVEIENLFELTDGVTLALDGTWIPHAEYGKDPQLHPALSGNRFRYTPEFAGNATVTVDTPINDTVNLTGRLQFRYTSAQNIATAGPQVQDAVGLVNVNLGFKVPESGLTVEGWAQNLFKKTYFTNAFNTPLQSGEVRAYTAAPRTYGVRVRAEF